MNMSFHRVKFLIQFHFHRCIKFTSTLPDHRLKFQLGENNRKCETIQTQVDHQSPYIIID